MGEWSRGRGGWGRGQEGQGRRGGQGEISQNSMRFLLKETNVALSPTDNGPYVAVDSPVFPSANTDDNKEKYPSYLVRSGHAGIWEAKTVTDYLGSNNLALFQKHQPEPIFACWHRNTSSAGYYPFHRIIPETPSHQRRPARTFEYHKFRGLTPVRESQSSQTFP